MSVAQTFTLPAQPPTGVLRRVPLGGNGYTDPFAMYTLRNYAVTGDATNGSVSLTVVMDRRYCSLVSYCSGIYTAAGSSPAPFRWLLGSGTNGTTPNMFRQRRIVLGSTEVSAAIITDMWLPPAFLLPGGDFSELVLTGVNEDTDIMQMFTVIYLFNINARQKVPYSHLVQSRGGIGNSD